jgi:hypothetical protein
MIGNGLTKLKEQPLFQDNLTPVSVNSISSSVPNQFTSDLKSSACPLSNIFPMKMASF